MKTIERICAHDVEFNYFSRSKNAVPDECEIGHVETMLHENCEQGQLVMNTVINGREHEFEGWWKILRENN